MVQKENVSLIGESISRQPAGLEEKNEVQILLVENNCEEANAIIKAIRGFDISNRVFWVRSGDDAMNFLLGRGLYANKAFNNQPKLIFLDLRLPKINGLEVLKQIRSTEKTKNMPVILFVSSCQEMDMLESLRPNDCSYIVKPIDFLNLKEAIWNTQYFILPTFWDAEEKHVLYQMG